MTYLVGFIFGVAVCAVVAHVYLTNLVNKELNVVHQHMDSLLAQVEARVASVRQAAADKVAGAK